MSNNNSVVSSKWHDYHRLMTIVAVILLMLLLLLWLLGYGPGGSKCKVPPTIVEKTVEVEKIVDNPKLLSRISELEAGNKKISGLMATITGLKSENEKLGSLTKKLKILESENADLPRLKAVISKLKADNAQIAVLTAKLKALKAKNSKIPSLQKKVQELKSTQPKVIERIKVVKKAVKVPATPVKPGAVPVAPKAPAAPKNTISKKKAKKAVPKVAKLYFDVDSANFPEDVNLSLARMISYLKDNSTAKVTIFGFYDATGSIEANKKLSLKRAESVLRLLVESGLSINSATIEEPQQTESTASSQAARRVEVSIVK